MVYIDKIRPHLHSQLCKNDLDGVGSNHWAACGTLSWNIMGFLRCKKRKWHMTHPEDVACPTPSSIGPIFAGKVQLGHFRSSDLKVNLEQTKLFCGDTGPLSPQNDYLNMQYSMTLLACLWTAETMAPIVPTGKTSTCCKFIPACDKSVLTTKEYTICRPHRQIETYSLAMDS